MQWTLELNDLLNQCVFECGYDFTDASRLLETRARTLRLLPNCSHALTADACQVQWMAINPVDDESEYDDDSDDLQQQQPERNVTTTSRAHADAAAECERLVSGRTGTNEAANEPAAAITMSPSLAASAAARPPSSLSSLFEGAPLLELSISDAELDALISSLPVSSSSAPVPEDDSDMCDSSADAKQHQYRRSAAVAEPTPASEMQWVLSFLTDPDDAAQHDSEAKCLLETVDKREDDNYQLFLQELHDANLLVRSTAASDVASRIDDALNVVPAAVAVVAEETLPCTLPHEHPSSFLADDDNSARVANGNRSDSDASDDSDDDDWEVVRQSIKSQVVPRVAVAASATPTATPLREAVRVRVPPAPTRVANARAPREFENASAMHAHVSPSPLQQQQLTKMQQTRVALSREIGDLLETTGAFQFPKRLFPHHNDVPEQSDGH